MNTVPLSELLSDVESVRWNFVRARFRSHPHEIRENLTLSTILSRRIDDYPPDDVIESVIEEYPAAVWENVDDGRTPLFLACSRRASAFVLRKLTQARPSVKKDGYALVALWKAYEELFGGTEELCDFLERRDTESINVTIKILTLLSYLANDTLLPLQNVHDFIKHVDNLFLLQTCLDMERLSLASQDSYGRTPLHYLAMKEIDRSALISHCKVFLEFDQTSVHTKDNLGRLPAHYSLENGRVLPPLAVPGLLTTLDAVTGLLPFQLLAMHEDCSLDDLYSVIRKYPGGLKDPIQDETSITLPLLPRIPDPSTPSALVLRLAKKIGDESRHFWEQFSNCIKRKGVQDVPHLPVLSAIPMCPVALLRMNVSFGTSVVHMTNRHGETALHTLASIGKAELEYMQDDFDEDDELPCFERMEYLLDVYPQAIEMRDQDGLLPLHRAAASGLPLVCLKRLVTAWPEALTRRDATEFMAPPLHSACSQESTLDELYYLILSSPTIFNREC